MYPSDRMKTLILIFV